MLSDICTLCLDKKHLFPHIFIFLLRDMLRPSRNSRSMVLHSILRHYSIWPTLCMTLFYILILNSISLYMQYKRNESFLFYVHAYLNLKRIWNLNLSLRKEAESWNPIRQLMDQSHHPIIQDYPKILLEHRYRTVLKEFRQLWSTTTFFFANKSPDMEK